MKRLLLYAATILVFAISVTSCSSETVVVRREYTPVPYRYEYYNIYQIPRYSTYHPYYYHWYNPKPHRPHHAAPQQPPKPKPKPAPNATVRPPRQSGNGGSMSGRRR